MWYLTQWQLRSNVDSMAAKGSDALENYFNNRRYIKEQMNYKSAAVFSRNPVDAERAGLRDPYRALDHQTTSNKSRNDSEKLSRSVQYSFK